MVCSLEAMLIFLHAIIAGEEHGNSGATGRRMEPSQSARPGVLADVLRECQSDLGVMHQDGLGARCGSAPESVAESSEDGRLTTAPACV